MGRDFDFMIITFFCDGMNFSSKSDLIFRKHFIASLQQIMQQDPYE
jgi:hypothetical protein